MMKLLLVIAHYKIIKRLKNGKISSVIQIHLNEAGGTLKTYFTYIVTKKCIYVVRISCAKI